MSSHARLALLACLALAACRTTSDGPVKRLTPRKEGAPVLQEHKRIDPASGKPAREWTSITQGDQPAAKHGKEILRRKDGSTEWEKDWDHGRPSGVWRRWYANGQMQSECFFSGPETERVMTFWHSNGQRRLQGPAKDGVRCGHWKVWFEDGQLAEEGEYAGSRREGEWQVWSQDGKRRFVRVYRHDVRTEEREGPPVDAPPPADPAPVPTPTPGGGG